VDLIAVTVLAAFLLVGLFVGAWLVRLLLPTGKQLELLVGVSILGLGPVGFAPIGIAVSGAGGGFDLRDGVSLAGQLNILLRATILSWTSAESFRQWAMLQKRSRLGLSEPVLTNRFALWGTATGAASIITLMAFVSAIIDIRTLAAGDVLNLTISLIGFIATPCMLLAFSPPVAYRRYLLRRQPETQPAD